MILQAVGVLLQVAMTLEQRRIRSLASQGSGQQDFLAAEGRLAAAGMEAAAPPLSLPSGDDSEAVLGLAELLAVSKHAKARAFAASLYQTVFR